MKRRLKKKPREMMKLPLSASVQLKPYHLGWERQIWMQISSLTQNPPYYEETSTFSGYGIMHLSCSKIDTTADNISSSLWSSPLCNTTTKPQKSTICTTNSHLDWACSGFWWGSTSTNSFMRWNTVQILWENLHNCISWKPKMSCSWGFKGQMPKNEQVCKN